MKKAVLIAVLLLVGCSSQAEVKPKEDVPVMFTTTDEATLTIQDQPYSFIWEGDNDEGVVLEITSDGKVNWHGDQSRAAKAFWNYVISTMPSVCENYCQEHKGEICQMKGTKE